jgi:hypothetical protein
MNILIIVRDNISYKNYFILLNNTLHTGVPAEATKLGKYCIIIKKKTKLETLETFYLLRVH